MKYTMERTTKVDAFKPFTIEITIETEEEYKHFHNNVAGKITKGSHPFIGDLFRMGKNKQDDAVGEI